MPRSPVAKREEILNTVEREKIEAVLKLCQQARDALRGDAPFRLRVLLDMTLLELGKELAQATGRRVA